MYFLAYVGSRRVKDLPLHLVAPDTVMTTKINPKAAVARPNASLVKMANYSSARFLLTYSIMT